MVSNLKIYNTKQAANMSQSRNQIRTKNTGKKSLPHPLRYAYRGTQCQLSEYSQRLRQHIKHASLPLPNPRNGQFTRRLPNGLLEGHASNQLARRVLSPRLLTWIRRLSNPNGQAPIISWVLQNDVCL